MDIKQLVYRLLILLIVVSSLSSCSDRHHRRRKSKPKPQPPIEIPDERNDSNVKIIDSGKDDAYEYTHITPAIYDKPNIARIKSDLVGHSLKEGVGEGYMPDNWTYLINANSIEDVWSVDTITCNESQYIIELNLKLASSGNYYYDSKIKIWYRYSKNNGWVFDELSSLGLNIISDKRYDDCITTSVRRTAGNTPKIYFNNNSESTLLVGGRWDSYGTIEKFLLKIPGHSSESVFSRDYIIDFVIKEFSN